jgi:phage gp16-like protein
MSALAKIHIAKKELGLHDDDYRATLERLTGKRSAKDLTEAQAGLVIEEFKRRGWVPKVVAGGSTAPKPPYRQPGKSIYGKAVAAFESAKKARALWISLWQLGAIDDSSEAALEAFAKRQLKCERLVWADQQQMYKLIEALKAMAERSGWRQSLANVPVHKWVWALKFRLYERQIDLLGELEGQNLAHYEDALLNASAPLTVEALTQLNAQIGSEIHAAKKARA